MTITVVARPARLQWSLFKRVAHLPGMTSLDGNDL
jgi:hypothetical protein